MASLWGLLFFQSNSFIHISEILAMLKIEIVSDVACPWCIIGYTSLQAAIKELDQPVDISWRPFELNPSMPLEGQTYADYSRTKYHRTEEQSKANLQNVTQRGLDVGYEFNFTENTRIYNTFDAHRLLYWAKEFDLQTQLKLALFDLNFKQGCNLSNHDVLVGCAEKVGLDPDAAKAVLEQSLYSDEVKTEIDWAHQNGIHSVPTFIFNDQHLVSGGQPKETFMRFLKQLNAQV